MVVTEGMPEKASILKSPRSSQISCICSKCNGALTFQNLCQDGYKTAQELSVAGVPAEIVHDVAVGFVMQEADIVLTGAAGVCESGGIVNKIGTYQVFRV